MSNKRLLDLEETIDMLQEQLSGMERERALAPLGDKVRISQQIKEKKKEIKSLEKDYWDVVSESSELLDFPEEQSQGVLTEVIKSIAKLEEQRASYPDNMMEILQEIRDKLNEPGTTASGKLKGILSSFPPFIGLAYEAEIDTENFARKYFPTFTKLIGAASKK